jgi:hypothetical protein
MMSRHDRVTTEVHQLLAPMLDVPREDALLVHPVLTDMQQRRRVGVDRDGGLTFAPRHRMNVAGPAHANFAPRAHLDTRCALRQQHLALNDHPAGRDQPHARHVVVVEAGALAVHP